VDPVDAGGTVGVACRECFAAWDDADQELTLDARRWVYAPDELVSVASLTEPPLLPVIARQRCECGTCPPCKRRVRNGESRARACSVEGCDRKARAGGMS
jgi:hypothetical protein